MALGINSAAGWYRLAPVTADGNGVLNLYLGTNSASVSMYAGFDEFQLTQLPLSASGVINGSFENPGVAWDGNYDPNPTSGWSHGLAAIVNSGDSQFSNTTGSPGTLPGTARGVQFCGTGSGSGPGTGGAGMVFQRTAANLATNTIYTLTVAAGKRLDMALPANGTMELHADSDTGVLLGSLDVITGALAGSAFNPAGRVLAC